MLTDRQADNLLFVLERECEDAGISRDILLGGQHGFRLDFGLEEYRPWAGGFRGSFGAVLEDGAGGFV
jgi:hypothetical protein